MSCSSKAIITSPFEVSSRINFNDPSLSASTHCFDLPIKEVMYALTFSVVSVSKLDFIGRPLESHIITPRTPSFSSNRRIIAFTSATSITFYHTFFNNYILDFVYTIKNI